MSYDPFWRTRPLQYALEFVYSLVIAVFWIPVFVLRCSGRFVREVGVENWPQADGSITGGRVKVIHGWIVDYALGRLDYCYRVAGEYYAGSITGQYPDEQAAWNFVDAHSSKPVVVRYKDDNAQASALRDADQEPSWTDGTGPGLLATVWQHWRDELRGEQPAVSDDDGAEADDEDDEKVNHTDPVGR